MSASRKGIASSCPDQEYLKRGWSRVSGEGTKRRLISCSRRITNSSSALRWVCADVVKMPLTLSRRPSLRSWTTLEALMQDARPCRLGCTASLETGRWIATGAVPGSEAQPSFLSPLPRRPRFHRWKRGNGGIGSALSSPPCRPEPARSLYCESVWERPPNKPLNWLGARGVRWQWRSIRHARS